MSKLRTIGSRLFVLAMGFLIAAVVGNLVALGCLLWWPGMVQVVLECTLFALIFGFVLGVFAPLLANILKMKGE